VINCISNAKRGATVSRLVGVWLPSKDQPMMAERSAPSVHFYNLSHLLQRYINLHLQETEIRSTPCACTSE
jgi:hypothetical protein